MPRVAKSKAKKTVKKPYKPYTRRIRGKGDYTVDPEINKSLKNIGRQIGSYFGQGDMGSDVANVFHRGFKQITGIGDYTIKHNTVLSPNTPLFGDGKASVRIQHREFISDVKSSINFSAYKFPVQVGMPSMFPWLSQVADNYQEYKINGMIFEFISKSADALNSTNTALGSVFMGVDYNALAPAPISKQEILNLEFSGTCKPSSNLMVPLECDPSITQNKNKFVRTPFTPGSALGDLRMYDYANLFFATEGSQAIANIGEFWVTYDISLYKAKIPKMGGYTDHFEFEGATTSLYFGPLADLETQTSSNFGCTIDENSITLPDYYEGQIMIYYYLVGDSTATTVPTLTPSGNVSVLNILVNDTENDGYINSTNIVQNFIAFYNVIKADTPGENKVTLSGGTLPANVYTGDLIVSAINITN